VESTLGVSAVEDAFSDYNILAANKVSNTTHCAQGYWIFGCHCLPTDAHHAMKTA